MIIRKFKLITVYIAALFCFAFAMPALSNSLTANVDRTSIGENETLTLTVQYQGDRVDSDPDFSGLSQQFDVLQNQKSMQHSVINGKISSSTEWTLTLAPKNTGQLLIPPFSLQKSQSRPINISVSKASSTTPSGHEDVFLETSVDQKDGYVQEQFIITYRLFYNRRVDNLDMPDLSVANTRIETLPRVDYQTNLGGTTYGVSEFRYALFADSSGAINIPGQTWTVRTTDQASINRFGFGGGRYKLHRVKTDPIQLQIKPKPDDYPANEYWLPAQELTLSEQWSQDPQTFKIGEPITRSVVITAVGASGEQLPELFNNLSDPNFKFYPDKPSQDTQLEAKGVVGSRTESVAIVPTKTGPLTLPEVKVTWWDSAQNKLQVSSLPAITVDVQASDNVNSQQVELPQLAPPTVDAPTIVEPEPKSSYMWQILSLILLLGNVLFAYLWLRARSARAEAPLPSVTKTINSTDPNIERACQNQSAKDLYQALVNWVAKNYPERPPTLATLSKIAGNTSFAKQLANLEANLYADSNEQVNYSEIQTTMKKLTGHASKTHAHRGEMAELYPG